MVFRKIVFIICGIAATVEGAGHPSNLLNFYVNPRAGAYPLEVSFTDMSEQSYDSLHWDFGDGHSATDSCPVHTYTESGLYNVTLTGYTGDVTRTITHNKIVEARLLNICSWLSSIPFSIMKLDNLVMRDGAARIIVSDDTLMSGSASFVMDVYFGSEPLYLRVDPDLSVISYVTMALNGEQVFACTLDYSDSLFTSEITVPGIEIWDTVAFTISSDSICNTGLLGLRDNVYADCFGPPWFADWGDTARIEVGEQYSCDPYIFGCGGPCRICYYIDEAPATMSLSMQGGRLTWQPTITDTGIHNVLIRNLPADRIDRLTFVVERPLSVYDEVGHAGNMPIAFDALINRGIVQIQTNEAGEYDVQLIDAAGNVISQISMELTCGINCIRLGEGLEQMIGFLRVSSGRSSVLRKVVLLP